MSEDVSFRNLIQRVRSGDGEAAAELVRCYEPTIRLMVRRRLTDPTLRRLFDSMDICQCVLASFFVRAASGQYELDEPGQLLRLLAAMARNKVASEALKQRAARRGLHRIKPGGLAGSSSSTPGRPRARRWPVKTCSGRFAAASRRKSGGWPSSAAWAEPGLRSPAMAAAAPTASGCN